jgi:chloride channel 2
LFGILGMLCGLLGTIVINILTKVIFLRDRLRVPFLTNRWLWGLFVALVTSLITFPVSFMQLPHKTIVNTMFSIDHIDTNNTVADWNHPALGFNMVIFCILQFLLIVLALSAPVPSGVLSPCFTLGAVFGRFYGYVLRHIGLWMGISLVKHEGIYAIIGAAATAGSVTRTISVAIIVFELTA